MRHKTTRFKWLVSLAHGFILLALSMAFTYNSYTYAFDEFFVKWCSITKRVIFNVNEEISKKDYLFVDLSNEKALIPVDDGSGNEVITDRTRLAAFFRVIKRHQQEIKFTLCDVFLQGHSPGDSVLSASLSGIRNIVFPTHFDDNGRVEPLVLPVKHGLADYDSDSEFFKFRVIQNDTLPTIPVLIYSALTGRVINCHGFWPLDNGTPMLNSVIIDYPVRSQEVFEEQQFTVVKLSDLLALPEDLMVHDYLKGRIIVMGDFKSDIHQSIYGPMPGTLVLLNIYLMLLEGHQLISFWWILGMLAAFVVLSHLMFFPQMKKELSKRSRWLGLLSESFIFLLLLSIASYFFGHKPVEVLVLTFYINAVTFIVQVHRAGWSWLNVKKEINKLLPKAFNFKVK